jgi:alanine or glycine:cation symporter, AGCS family
MSFEEILRLGDYVLFFACVFILLGSVLISFKTRFVQIRFIPHLFKMLKNSLSQSSQEEGSHSILPHKALFTAMSTTLGMGTIVGPVIAINLGGPGALLGFLLTSFFGSAATFTEVSLSLQHRKKLESGEIMGGPMQYLQQLLSPAAAKWYALCCFLLMIAWSGAQSNQVAAILDSPLLGDFRVPKLISGAIIAVLVTFLLMGGIKRVGAFSAKLVPTMFVIYLGACSWIVFSNLDKLAEIFATMFSSIGSPYEMASGGVVGGLMSAMRWGVFKGTQANEAGIGTQTIPHSMAETKDPFAQGTVAMLSTYTAGVVAFLSGCVALITHTWEDPALPLGMSMVAASFQMYFSSFGVLIVGIVTLLFGFGTILGNSYNGSQCFGYLTQNKGIRYYFLGTALIVFLGAIAETKTFWAFTDIILAAMALPHMLGLILHAFKKTEVFPLKSSN